MQSHDGQTHIAPLPVILTMAQVNRFVAALVARHLAGRPRTVSRHVPVVSGYPPERSKMNKEMEVINERPHDCKRKWKRIFIKCING